jgi:hypothetical protein
MATTVTPAVLQGGVVLTTINVVYVTAPANTTVVIKNGVITNPSGNATTTYTCSVLRSGGSLLVVIPARNVVSPGTDLMPELANFVLNPGDVLELEASSAAILNFFASGFYIS